jgi:virginiamycin B lyase
LWFTNLYGNSIGRITTSGVVTRYTAPGVYRPFGIVAGSDGALWFTNFVGNAVFSGNSIGRITTAGAVTLFTGGGINSPLAITVGPDGALWFTNSGPPNSIGRITTSGLITNYPVGSSSVPSSITVGPDGALWFTNEEGNSIGRITTAGEVTSFALPGTNYPQSIATGPDGALWFATGTGSIGRLTTTGEMSSFPTGTIGTHAITSGPDGALWFLSMGNNVIPDSIGRITTSGVVTLYPEPGFENYPQDITTGPDGALWFTNLNASSIGRITTPSGPGLSLGDMVVRPSAVRTRITVPLFLSTPSTSPVTVHVTSQDGTARSFLKYLPVDREITFAPGQVAATVDVYLTPSRSRASSLSFQLLLSDPVGAAIVRGAGTITVVDNPSNNGLSISDATIVEGDAGRPTLPLAIQLAQPVDHDVTVDWATADGTAHTPGQYDDNAGTVTIPAGATEAKVRVVIHTNTKPEPTKTFSVVQSNAVGAALDKPVGTVTILDDDS